MNFDNESSKIYWEKRFDEAAIAHSQQNGQISSDFFLKIKKWKSFDDYIKKSNSILEVGCGTGEFCNTLFSQYPNTQKNILGTDISKKAILFASENYSNENLSFQVFDSLNHNIEDLGGFDLIVSSNTLEHFRDPYVVIDNMVENSKVVLILVPYEQPCTDGYDKEGGAGHVFTFTLDSFVKYETLDSFEFETSGWQYSSKGEKPLQLAVLLKGNYY